MPSETDSPLIMVSARYDLRPFRSTAAPGSGKAFKQGAGGTSVTFPAWTGKEGVFRDVVEMLNGHGTELGLSDDLQAQWAADGGAGTVSMGIDADGYVTVTNASGGGVDLELDPSADNAVWGLPTAGATIADGATLTGTDYPIGITGTVGSTPPYLTFERASTTTKLTVPTVPAYFTDVRCSLRTRTTIADIDSGGGRTDPSECIEALDNDYTDPTGGGETRRRARWAIDCGSTPVRILRTVPVGTAGAAAGVPNASDALVWEDDDLRQILGASGDEAVTQTGAGARDVYVQIFDFLPLYLLAPSKARDQLRPSSMVDRRSRMTRDTRAYTHVIRHQKKWRLTFRLDGPVDLDDQHLDFVEQTHEAMLSGPVCLFMRRGDSRRARRRRAGGQSLLYTTGDAARDGYRGRVYCQVNGDETSVDWPTALMSSAPVVLVLDVLQQETADT